VAFYSPRKKEKWVKHCILLPQPPYFGDFFPGQISSFQPHYQLLYKMYAILENDGQAFVMGRNGKSSKTISQTTKYCD